MIPINPKAGSDFASITGRSSQLKSFKTRTGFAKGRRKGQRSEEGKQTVNLHRLGCFSQEPVSTHPHYCTHAHIHETARRQQMWTSSKYLWCEPGFKQQVVGNGGNKNNAHTHTLLYMEPAVYTWTGRWKDGAHETVLFPFGDFIVQFFPFLSSPPHIQCMSVCECSSDTVQCNPTPCTVICELSLHLSQPEWHWEV